MDTKTIYLIWLLIAFLLPFVADKMSYLFWQLIRVINKEYYQKMLVAK